MQTATYQPQVSNAAMAGTRPLEWPSVDVMQKHVWGKRMSPAQMQEAEKKFLRDKASLQGSYKDFEAVFVGMLLKQMNKTVEKNPMFHGGHVEDMFTEQLSDEMAKNLVQGGKGFGIAQMLEQQHLRTTYYGNKDFATLIRKDLDAKAKSAANKEIEGTKNLGEEKLKEAEKSAQAEYEAHKAELLAGTGLEEEAVHSNEKLAAANVERRMLELQQSQAYRQVTAKGFGIR